MAELEENADGAEDDEEDGAEEFSPSDDDVEQLLDEDADDVGDDDDEDDNDDDDSDNDDVDLDGDNGESFHLCNQEVLLHHQVTWSLFTMKHLVLFYFICKKHVADGCACEMLVYNPLFCCLHLV